jgi:carbon monoxide dehydrogenase subunit G
MEMSGEYRIAAPRQKVWAALNDPDILRASIPGCKALEKTADDRMTATVEAKVGPVKAKFAGEVTLSNIDAPKSYTISGEGKGGVAGYAKGGADVVLEEDGQETLLRYTAKAQVGGKLAQVGARLIDATAKQMADKFFSAFAEKVGAPAEEEEGIVERAEHAVEEAAHDVAEVAHQAEQRAEGAAARGFLGGPEMWGLIALAVVIVLLLLLR